MAATIKQTQTAIRALDKAFYAMEPLVLEIEHDPRDAMLKLRGEISETCRYLDGLVRNKNSWLWKAQP